MSPAPANSNDDDGNSHPPPHPQPHIPITTTASPTRVYLHSLSNLGDPRSETEGSQGWSRSLIDLRQLPPSIPHVRGMSVDLMDDGMRRHDSHASGIAFPNSSEQTLYNIAASLHNLDDFVSEFRKTLKDLRRKELQNERARIFSANAVMGIFLASVLVALLTIPQAPDVSPARQTADNVVNVCWIIGFIFSVLGSFAAANHASELSDEDEDERYEEAAFRSYMMFQKSLMISAGVFLLLGVSVWAWNNFPGMVGVVSTALGIGLLLFFFMMTLRVRVKGGGSSAGSGGGSGSGRSRTNSKTNSKSAHGEKKSVSTHANPFGKF